MDRDMIMTDTRRERHVFAAVCAVVCAVFLMTGCASYYQRNLAVQKAFVSGDFERALNELDKNDDDANGNNRFLYLTENGTVLHMLERYDKSNEYFEEAHIFVEDFHQNRALQALSLISNPSVTQYGGEDFEKIFIHYYKALNYIALGELDNALVECRRINIRLNELNDKYGTRKNRYRTDAFAYMLMGIIFEASGEINNAFISYRNAYETYRDVYEPIFDTPAPDQLKKDLMRTAALNGFTQELEQYEQEFGATYTPPADNNGELVFFWNNGLGPVKEDWGVTFTILKGRGGIVTFQDSQGGMSFPFETGSDSIKKLGDLKFVKIAFPRYRERTPYFNHAVLKNGSATYSLEVAEDINGIANATLQDRMLREFATSLLRVAIKQAAEEATRKKNENLGAVLSLVNMISESSDTRGWQMLPHTISYTRIPLEEGKNELELVASGAGGETLYTFEIEAKPGNIYIDFFHSLDTVVK